jgi:peptide/nickel transport system ATP-binding protein
MLELRRLVKRYPVQAGFWSAESLIAVDDVSLSIESGQTLGLVGESGSGKSTLGRCALLLERPTSGEVLFEDVALTTLGAGAMRRMRRQMQVVFQDPYGSLNPRMRVAQILAEPFQIHEKLSRAEIATQVAGLLATVGLPADSAGRYPHEFSGGQRQRIGIARALALRPKFIVADEPVSALDVSVGAQIVNLLADLQQQFGLTYLFISHSLPVVRHISTRVAVMYMGRLCEAGPTDAIFERPLHPYTVLLRRSTPDPSDVRQSAFRTPQSEMPSALHPPSGCRFRTRCPLAQPRCAEETPPLREAESGHLTACHYPEQAAML